MKIRIIVLIVAVVGVSVCRAQDQQPSGDRVGYANMEYIISRLPDMKQIETELKSTQTQLKNQIEAKSKEVQKQYADFNATAASMVDSVREKRQQEVEQAIASLEQMQEDARLTLQNKQKLFMAPLYLKVNRAIGEVARENGFTIILTAEVSNFPFLLYHRQEMDVSKLVLAKFGVTTAGE